MFDVLFGLFASKKLVSVVAAILAVCTVFVFVYMYVGRKEELEKRESEREVVIERERTKTLIQQRDFVEAQRKRETSYNKTLGAYKKNEQNKRRDPNVDESDYRTVPAQ